MAQSTHHRLTNFQQFNQPKTVQYLKSISLLTIAACNPALAKTYLEQNGIRTASVHREGPRQFAVLHGTDRFGGFHVASFTSKKEADTCKEAVVETIQKLTTPAP